MMDTIMDNKITEDVYMDSNRHLCICCLSTLNSRKEWPLPTHTHTNAWLDKILSSPPTGGWMHSPHLLYKMAVHITADVLSLSNWPVQWWWRESGGSHHATREHICKVWCE